MIACSVRHVLSAAEEPHDGQQNNCADKGGDDRTDPAVTELDMQHAGQSAADERTSNADDDIEHDAEASTSHQHAREPAPRRSR